MLITMLSTFIIIHQSDINADEDSKLTAENIYECATKNSVNITIK